MNMPFQGAKMALFAGSDLVVILRDDIPEIPFPNHWDMPGGGREGDETPLGCVLREVHEELNLSVPADAVVWGRQFSVGRVANWFFVAHLPASAAADVVLGDEGQKWRLMSPDVYFKEPNRIEHFAERLRLYQSGMAGDPFERPPAN